MYLYWYKIKDGINNFGDQLNPYIVGKLNGCEVDYLPIADAPVRRILKCIKGLFHHQYSFHDLAVLISSLKEKHYYVAIGSVIEWIRGKNCHVWGAGLIKRNGLIKECQFHAVRGKITEQRIKELGYTSPFAIGDPAILLPLIYKPRTKKRYETGIIPHYIHYQEIKKQIGQLNNQLLLINLQDDTEKIIDQIYSCKKIITSSLHGLITAHSYQIPALWVRLSEQPLAGDNVKFSDYFSSVEIKTYPPFTIHLKDKISEEIINNLFLVNKKLFEPQINLSRLQKNLLKAAPFEILEKYKKFINHEG